MNFHNASFKAAYGTSEDVYKRQAPHSSPSPSKKFSAYYRRTNWLIRIASASEGERPLGDLLSPCGECSR